MSITQNSNFKYAEKVCKTYESRCMRYNEQVMDADGDYERLGDLEPQMTAASLWYCLDMIIRLAKMDEEA